MIYERIFIAVDYLKEFSIGGFVDLTFCGSYTALRDNFLNQLLVHFNSIKIMQQNSLAVGDFEEFLIGNRLGLSSQIN